MPFNTEHIDILYGVFQYGLKTKLKSDMNFSYSLDGYWLDNTGITSGDKLCTEFRFDKARLLYISNFSTPNNKFISVIYSGYKYTICDSYFVVSTLKHDVLYDCTEGLNMSDDEMFQFSTLYSLDVYKLLKILDSKYGETVYYNIDEFNKNQKTALNALNKLVGILV